jgi:hypothetical protein
MASAAGAACGEAAVGVVWDKDSEAGGEWAGAGKCLLAGS